MKTSDFTFLCNLCITHICRAVARGVKGGEDYGGGTLKLTGHCCASSRLTIAYHLHVFLSLANSNIQKSLKHSNTRCRKAEPSTCAPCLVHTRREPRLTDSKTEPSSPSPPPASERTNTNCSLNMQTEKKM